MSVEIGARLGPYEITAKLGQGGMGEVYRATDARLRREVAIKVLPAAFTADREQSARFEREAQLLAQLHHPNIASIFGVEESGGTRALVMELVEGPTLAERLESGPLPLAECVSVAAQIAAALEEAHEKGIVHRDLKPQNVKASVEGKVKVLDFGLAKAMDPPRAASGPGSASQLAQSPTMTLGATQLGVILGTAAYMAPEQAKGLGVDKRADIWAFGVVAFEMLVGKRLFSGETVPEILADVLRAEIDLGRLPASTPVPLRRLLARCLERDPKKRLRDIGEARLLLGGAEATEESAASALLPVPAPRRSWTPWLAVPVVAALAAIAAWIGKPAPAPPTSPTLRLSIALAPGEQVTTAPAISPDGRTVAYAAGRSAPTSRLYLRGLDDFAAREVDSSGAPSWPFFSPDGRSVAFFARGKLWRAEVAGGAATMIASAPRPFGGAWGADRNIVYAPTLDGGLWRVPADGGAAEQLTQPDYAERGYAHVFPQSLGTGQVLFTLWGRTFHSDLLSADGTWRPVTNVVNRGGVSFYAESGHLLRGDVAANLLAAPWNAGAAEPVRPEAVALQSVYWWPGSDRPWIAVSANGTAAYAPGSPDHRHLVWVDRDGRATQLEGDGDQITQYSISRDGRRVVHSGRSSQWIRDLETGTRTRVVADVSWSWAGGWLSGDRRIVLSSNKSGDWDLYTVSVSGGDMEPLLVRPRTQHPMTVAPDGTVLFLDYGVSTGIDIWKLSPRGEASPVVVTPWMDGSPSVSPDGRYLAYTSDESGRQDVYVIPFSDPAAGQTERLTVSIDGGTGPVWSRDGRELFYRAGDFVMSAEVRSKDPLRLGEPRRVVDVSGFESQYFREFDVSPDGRRFLFIRAEPESRPTRIDVILNWFPELERRAR